MTSFPVPSLVPVSVLAVLGLAAALVFRRPAAKGTQAAWRAVAGLLTNGKAAAPHLVYLTLASAGLLVVSLMMPTIDGRQLGGVSVWVKPAKFAASVVVSAPVFAWTFASLAASKRRAGASHVVAVAFVVELVLITMQAGRGVHSHFNQTTWFDTAVFRTMAFAITLFWIAQLFTTYWAFRHRFHDPVVGWGLRLGLLLASVGAATAFVMPSRVTPAQAETLAAGKPAHVGSHTVGGEDGGPGLPVTRWSTKKGDLRVPHFIGLHALQVLPLAALALSRWRAKRGKSARDRDGATIIAFGVAWGGLLITTLVQALRGQPLFAPDAVTWSCGGAFVIAAAMTFVAVAATADATARAPYRALSRRPLEDGCG